MKKVVIGIGVPGSGKTTLLKAFAHNNKYIYICPDDIRAELTGDASNQTKNDEVWKEAYLRTEKELCAGNSVVFDATTADFEQRKHLLGFVRLKGAEKIQGIYVNVSLETAKERNMQRERKVPESVIEQMYKALTNFPPRVSDGFDSILLVDGNRDKAEVGLNLE